MGKIWSIIGSGLGLGLGAGLLGAGRSKLGSSEESCGEFKGYYLQAIPFRLLVHKLAIPLRLLVSVHRLESILYNKAS